MPTNTSTVSVQTTTRNETSNNVPVRSFNPNEAKHKFCCHDARSATIFCGGGILIIAIGFVLETIFYAPWTGDALIKCFAFLFLQILFHIFLIIGAMKKKLSLICIFIIYGWASMAGYFTTAIRSFANIFMLDNPSEEIQKCVGSCILFVLTAIDTWMALKCVWYIRDQRAATSHHPVTRDA